MNNNNNEDAELYDVNQYSDNELFNMLDLTNPTDRELEAKILMTIDKYSEIAGETAIEIKLFFESVYKHFFEEDEPNYNNTIIEGLTAEKDNILPINEKKKETNPKKETTELVQTTALHYGSSKLNPLLKETQKRVLHIDSSFRNYGNYPSSTNFLINLSERLTNIVSLRLHSISIPYTWYNISNVYNANFFILKGVTPGVEGVYEFKFEITAGSYSIPELITALNGSVLSIQNEHTEVDFGKTKFSYNILTSKIDLILDIKNVFTEVQYYLYFTTFTNAFDELTRQESIPGFLGLSNNIIPVKIAYETPSGVNGIIECVENTYTISSIYSNFQYAFNATHNRESNPNEIYEVIVDSDDVSGNNFFTILNYDGPSNYVKNESTIFNTVKISFIENSGHYTRGSIMESVNRSLLSHPDLTQNSVLQEFDISYNQIDASGSEIEITMRRYQLTFTLEPSSISHVSNMKQVIIFPDDIENVQPLWVGASSAFWFDDDVTLHQPNSIRGEANPVSTRYKIDSVPTISLICTRPNYDNAQNNYTITVQKSVDVGYPNGYLLNDYVGVKNYTEQHKDSEINKEFTDINPDTSKKHINQDVFYDVGSNKVRMQFDIFTSYDEEDYIADMSGCILSNIITDLSNNPIIDISNNSTNIFTGSFVYHPTDHFEITDSNNTITVNSRPGQGNYGDYTLKLTNGIYRTVKSFVNSINNSFIGIQGKTDIYGTSLNGLNMSHTKLSYVHSHEQVTWTLKYVIVNKMSSQDYKVVLNDTKDDYDGNDISGTSWKALLGFNEISYNLISSSINNYTSEIVSDNNVYVDETKLITISETNNTFSFIPYSNIKGLYDAQNTAMINVVATDGTYGLYQLYNELNNRLNANPETYGSVIYSDFDNNGNEYAVLQININTTYSAKDYELVFFDVNNVHLEEIENNTSRSFQTITWNVTIGWLFGFKQHPSYILSPLDANNSLYVVSNNYIYNNETGIIQITGDSCVDLHIYKNLYLIIDDFNQSHLNDGLVTGIRRNLDADRPKFSSAGTRVWNPVTKTYQSSILNANTGNINSDNQLFAANTISEENETYQTTKIYSDPPYVHDMFALIPLKIGSLSHGDVYTEYGGTLQDNDRKYFGPVDITKLNVQLLNDGGDILNLNGSQWSFSLVFEYLYNFKGL
jgi:hypothetical protein